jgi:GMP synthase (glutamine-hydrolysing)
VRVLSVVHGPLVGPELFGEVILEAGHELLEWDISAGGDPPETAADALLVLGGHMNVGEESEHPWLEREYELLRGAVAAGVPLLGICLGAQTLAHAFGAAVAPAPERLAGFLEVSLTEAGRVDPVLGVLPERFAALFANAYAFALPAGAVELVSLPTGPQAFRVGERAWGLQFHPEARLAQVLAWWDGSDDLPRPLQALGRELAAGMAEWELLGRALCRAFLEAAAPGSPAARPT